MTGTENFRIGDYLLSEIVRRVRRTADLSQRELATHAGVSNSLVGAIEAGTRTPSLPALQRILNTAGYRMVVVDVDGHLVVPLEVWQDVGDLAGRRFPAHLDTILDPVYGEWWADVYGLTAPPETFHRNRALRDYYRRLSRWEVRVAQLRNVPLPDPPRGLAVGRRGQELRALLDACREPAPRPQEDIEHDGDEYDDECAEYAHDAAYSDAVYSDAVYSDAHSDAANTAYGDAANTAYGDADGGDDASDVPG